MVTTRPLPLMIIIALSAITPPKEPRSGSKSKGTRPGPSCPSPGGTYGQRPSEGDRVIRFNILHAKRLELADFAPTSFWIGLLLFVWFSIFARRLFLSWALFGDDRNASIQQSVQSGHFPMSPRSGRVASVGSFACR